MKSNYEPILELSENSDREHHHVLARITFINKETYKVDHTVTSYEHKLAPLHDAGMTLTCQNNSDWENNKPRQDHYGLNFESRGYGRMDMPKIIELGKILKTIDTKIKKLEAEYGYADTYSKKLTYLAKALGVKKFIYKSNWNDRSETDISGARSQVEYWMQKWKESEETKAIAVNELTTQLEA